ncbi:hypothetical protein D3C83_104690 [compost metagenome]
MPLGEPADERHPVEELEADLAEPRADDDRPPLAGERGELAVDVRGPPIADEPRRRKTYRTRHQAP